MFAIRRLALALAIAAVPISAIAQDEKPEPLKPDPRLEPVKKDSPVADIWRSLQFEISTGKYDMAAYYLKAFLAANPTDQDLTALEEKDGLASFLRLRNVPVWSPDAAIQKEAQKNAEDVIAKVNAALEKKLGDAGRINRYIANLRASPEEKAFAVRELQRSGARAVPQMVAALRSETDPAARVSILTVLPVLPEESAAPILAAMDMKDGVLKQQLLLALGERADFASLPARTELNPLPTLDYLSASPKEAPYVQKTAKELITRLRAVAASNLRPAKDELVAAANRFYKHEARFINPDAVPLWRWENELLVNSLVPATRAEEYFGLRYARWALELDPSDVSAQIAFLNIAIEKAFERIGLDGSLLQSQPAAHGLLALAEVTTLIAALDQALVDRKTSVALGITRVLGERAERLAIHNDKTRAGVLQRALEYPDLRVQFAAAEAIARIPGGAEANVQAKVVEILRQALSVESELSHPAVKPRALLVWFDRIEAEHVTKLLQSIGYDVVHVRMGQEALRRIKRSADIDAVLLDSRVANLELTDMLASLRGDSRFASLPVRVAFTPPANDDFAATANEARLRRTTYQTTMLREEEIRQAIAAETRVHRLSEVWPNVTVVRGPLTANVLKTSLTQETGDKPAALTPAEKKRYAATSIELFRQLALNSCSGFDLKPAERAIRRALLVDELARPAVDVVARLSGLDAQSDLAGVVLDAKRSPELRIAAAEALAAHMQRFTPMLTRDQVKNLDALVLQTPEPVLRGKIADVVGASGTVKTGVRIQSYVPPLTDAAKDKPAEKPAERPAEKPTETPPPKPEED